ncbi:hypothetical protein [Robertkochia flava]|uniref:hypothetical protein n=1 Tax=Robertkochia flava TaxID=3447986 RepID=UPI001CCB7372|nr:hypothetical protein [Robertkochia marina]
MKYGKLVLSIILDLVGMGSYLYPGIGEGADLIWAPLAGFLITRMYPDRSGKIGGLIGFVEELIPGMDVIPTFTLMWIYTYVYKRKEIGEVS